MRNQRKKAWGKGTRRPKRLVLVVVLLGMFVLPAISGVAPFERRVGQKGDPAQGVREAKAKLQQGVNAWKPGPLEEARNLFIQCLVQAKPQNSAVLNYYVALADYRLAVASFTLGDAAAAERWNSEGEMYLEKAMAANPAFAESFALYGYLLGLELALHPDRAMTLGMKSFGSFDDALQKDPENPRIHLLKGVYLLYVPQEYGGGPDRALESLRQAVSLFEKERVDDPLKPDWGKDEAYTYLGIVFKRKGETAKAREYLEKALTVNPQSGQAKNELAGLDRKTPA